MALVAYDYDSNSESGGEEEEESISTLVISKKPEEPLNLEPQPQTSFLSVLPKVKEQKAQIVEDKLEDFIPKYQPPPKKPKEKVKIAIPSLAEFDDDDDEPKQKKPKVMELKGSGLLALLPPVKSSVLSNKTFVPHVLKPKPKSTNHNLVPNNVKRRAELAKKAALNKLMKSNKSSSDVESDDEIEMPETFDGEMWNKVCGRQEKPKKVIRKPIEVEEPSAISVQPVNIAPTPVEPYDGLDNVAFKQLVGKSKRPVNIKLVDINEEDVLQDKDLFLTKQLTDPDSVPKSTVENPVDPTRKKKHHITYLAEQAKANEQELAGQWAANKFSRNATRAKYGF